ncbi:hypothetical protein FB451DRAFT_1191040 [Mycena latifolia]|nr:hypothetical protein FB451DRAFT_1191040 [Mycena latifolia]
MRNNLISQLQSSILLGAVSLSRHGGGWGSFKLQSCLMLRPHRTGAGSSSLSARCVIHGYPGRHRNFIGLISVGFQWADFRRPTNMKIVGFQWVVDGLSWAALRLPRA